VVAVVGGFWRLVVFEVIMKHEQMKDTPCFYENCPTDPTHNFEFIWIVLLLIMMVFNMFGMSKFFSLWYARRVQRAWYVGEGATSLFASTFTELSKAVLR
jgi:hypothetical protein